MASSELRLEPEAGEDEAVLGTEAEAAVIGAALVTEEGEDSEEVAAVETKAY